MDTPSLIEHIRENSRQMDPVPTGEVANIAPRKPVKAVVFDIYGTLFISGSGDISLAESDDRSPAIMGALNTAGFQVLSKEADWSGRFMETLSAFRESRQKQGVSFPEVRIEEVWTAFIESAREDGWLTGLGDTALAIVDHECRVNPCWPMPNLRETLEWLHQKNLKLGIVSNAQFYTPLLFPALTGKFIEEYHFDEALSVWSYREREGKPSGSLYQKLKSALAEMDISPAEALYIGNDLRNDIWPAGECGFQTVLFAGDKRSLRWRSTDENCVGVKPGNVVTDLKQLIDFVG